ncbi:hypothetical protein [Ferrimicrobium sp.]|uniref:hypothetical protein n=1 Tax=Ferrimicrobium sp. TaxID=2926050 RepID=UPI002616342A|nr:hypothetical protein [Ferrimicrobium sp.]
MARSAHDCFFNAVDHVLGARLTWKGDHKICSGGNRNIIASIDRRWDGAITTAQVEVDRATTDLAIVTADLLSTTPSALANKLTGLSVRRLSTIVRATANTHAAS